MVAARPVRRVQGLVLGHNMIVADRGTPDGPCHWYTTAVPLDAVLQSYPLDDRPWGATADTSHTNITHSDDLLGLCVARQPPKQRHRGRQRRRQAKELAAALKTNTTVTYLL